MQYETVQLCIDDGFIATADSWTVIEPVFLTANIYDGPEEYERSLKPFSRYQRQLSARHWYFSEVENGGHSQFYTNSTGIVWKDALAALTTLGLSDLAEVLQDAANLLGGSPSLDHETRCQQYEEHRPKFRSVDEKCYALLQSADMEHRILQLIRNQPGEFHFQGQIRRPVLPKFREHMRRPPKPRA